MDAGQTGQHAFGHILRALCRVLSRTSLAAVMQSLPRRRPSSSAGHYIFEVPGGFKVTSVERAVHMPSCAR